MPELDCFYTMIVVTHCCLNTARCSGVLMCISNALGLALYASSSVHDAKCPSHAVKCSACKIVTHKSV